jgi:hypothetical protein
MNAESCIENQLGWGSSDGWTMQEFETLSEQIREKNWNIPQCHHAQTVMWVR